MCRLAGIPHATLDYWTRTGLVEPSVRGSSGRRVERQWSIQDVLVVRSVKGLRDAGCPLQQVREAKKLLQAKSSEGLSDHVLFWDGGDVVAIDKWGNLQSLVRRPSQQMLHVVALPISSWKKALEADIEKTDASRSEKKTETR